jgi:hypothetical protein
MARTVRRRDAGDARGPARSGAALSDLVRSVLRENLWPRGRDAGRWRARFTRGALLCTASFALVVAGQTALEATTRRGWLNPASKALVLLTDLYTQTDNAIARMLVFWWLPVLTALVMSAGCRRFLRNRTVAPLLATGVVVGAAGVAFSLAWMEAWAVVVSAETAAVVWLRLLIIGLASAGIGLCVAWVDDGRRPAGSPLIESER